MIVVLVVLLIHGNSDEMKQNEANIIQIHLSQKFLNETCERKRENICLRESERRALMSASTQQTTNRSETSPPI